MRNFILFIRRFFNLILFLGVEIICMVLIARTRDMMQGNDMLSSANAVSSYFYDKRSDVVEYFGLRRMNDSLLNENTRLRQGLARYQSYDTLRDRTIVRPFTENDTTHVVHYAQYTYYEARVLSNSISASDNYLTINRGSANGITKNMAVISSTGVVGRVTNVSTHFATVLSILNNNKFRVSSKLKDGTTGSVNWQENGKPDELFMTGIPQQIKVKKGDSVYTTTYSTLFPRDLLIGTVFKVDIQEKDNSQTLHLHPATNFRNLQYVYVIKDDLISERRLLQDSLKAKKK